jgi:hypothetical protein
MLLRMQEITMFAPSNLCAHNKESPKHILIICRLKNLSFLQSADHYSCSR